jgi:hypothetical protein
MLRKCNNCLSKIHECKFFSEEYKSCKKCCTDEEVNSYVRPPLSKWMDGLTPTKKVLIIKQILKEWKQSNACKS